MTVPLTEAQSKTAKFIFAFMSAREHSPTFKEIRDGLGYKSLATVSQHVNALQTKGVLHRKRNHRRGMAFTEEFLKQNPDFFAGERDKRDRTLCATIRSAIADSGQTPGDFPDSDISAAVSEICDQYRHLAAQGGRSERANA